MRLMEPHRVAAVELLWHDIKSDNIRIYFIPSSATYSIKQLLIYPKWLRWEYCRIYIYASIKRHVVCQLFLKKKIQFLDNFLSWLLLVKSCFSVNMTCRHEGAVQTSREQPHPGVSCLHWPLIHEPQNRKSFEFWQIQQIFWVILHLMVQPERTLLRCVLWKVQIHNFM